MLKEVIAPWIAANAVNEKITEPDGVVLNTYHAIHAEALGTIVMIHGFCEFFGKYHELFYRFYQEGYSVYFIELRGHGLSGNTREFADHRITVGSFDEYVSDVHTLMEKCVFVQCPKGPKFLFSHSMGGAVSALYMEKYPEDFAGAVLSAPMMEIAYGMPDAAVGLAKVFSDATENDDEYAPTQGCWTGRYGFETSNSTCRERYDYQFKIRLEHEAYQTWGGTWAWAKAARKASKQAIHHADKIQTPILMFQAETDAMVTPEGQDAFCQRCPNTTLLKVKGVKHEIFSSPDDILEKYLEDIFVFYRAHLKNRKKQGER